MAPQAMQAIRVSGYGGPEQLKLEWIERPQPQAGEVLLRVEVVSISWRAKSQSLERA